MKFYLLIGKNSISVFEKEGNTYQRQYIEGAESYEYHLNSAGEEMEEFLEALANEQNLDTIAKLEFDVLENRDSVINNIVLDRTLNEYINERYSLLQVVKKLMKKYSTDKKLMIPQYGVNYDGENYRTEGKDIKVEEFSLLGYTLSDEDLIQFI